MSEEAKLAKAAAKAAKAQAKALRPFYKKKRWWLVALVVIVSASAAFSGGSGNNETTSSGDDASTSQTEDSISTGLGSKDASSDIVDIDCGTPDAIGVSYPTVTIKNNSSKKSDYFVTLVAESADGSTRYADTIVSAMGLNPGQTTTEKGMWMEEFPSGTICKVSEVQRTAS